MKSPIQLFIALAILLAAGVVAAQVYKWVDKDGKVQFTDTPPPPTATKEDAKKLVIKPAAGAGSGASDTPKSLAERNKDSDKRRADAGAKAKKDDEQRAADGKNEARCQEANSYLRDLESGRPLSHADANGDRTFMSDEERAANIAKAREVAGKACKN